MNVIFRIKLILLFGLLLASCSKETGSYDPLDVGNQGMNVPSVEQDLVVEDEQNVTPQTEQKPDVIINPQVNATEKVRNMVREANINFTSKDVVKTALAIEKMTYEFSGFVEQKDIYFNITNSRSSKIANDKIKIFEKVNPEALMTVRVPSEKAAIYVNNLLPLMHFLDAQQYSAKRYELKLLEEKIQQTQVVSTDTKNNQLNEISKLTQMEVQDRVRYSTIKISMKQPATVRERLDVDIDAVARINSDGFWTRVWAGISYGWQFILDLLVILITIWPIYLIFIIGLILYKFLKPLFLKMK